MPKPFSSMPGPKMLPIIGSVLEYSNLGQYSFERMHLAKKENVLKYGKIYKEKLGRDIVQLFDPGDIEKVLRVEGKFPIRPALPLLLVAFRRDKKALGLGSLNGEEWWKLRGSCQQPMMRADAALMYLPIQNLVASDLLSLVDHHLTDNEGEIKDTLPLLIKYTTEAFGAVCFNARIGCLQPQLSDQSRALAVMKATNQMFEAVQCTTFSFPTFAFWRTKMYRQFIESFDVCYSIARSYVNDTMAVKQSDSSKTNCNFLQTLVSEHSHRLTNDQMAQLTIDLFTAGIDSTANAITFCLYNLACNAEKQQLLQKELDSFVPDGCTVTAEHLSTLKYLKACVKESFRLNFPVEGGAVRELEKDLVLSDYHVPKKTLVSFNYQTICVQEEYFEFSDQFLPERWLKEADFEISYLKECSNQRFRQPPSFALVPFGYGPRMCIGRRFALQEIYLAVIKILQHYRLEYRQSQQVGMLNRVFTMPDAPVAITFIPRKQVDLVDQISSGETVARHL